MSLFSPLLIVVPDESAGPAARELAAALGHAEAMVASGFAQAAEMLRLRGSSPDYIVLDGAGADDAWLAALDDFAQECEPKVRVVAINADDALQAALKTRGVLAQFGPGAAAADIAAALMGAGAARPDEGKRGVVVGCMGATSGDGASTVAMNLASCLAATPGTSVVLVDMDYQFGLTSRNLELVAPFGVRELLGQPERGLDELLLGKMLVEYKPGMSVIAAPADLHLLPAIRPETVRELIALLRSKFDYVIIDVPHVWTPWTAAALSYCTVCIMVAQLWLRSLTHASRLLAAWHAVGIGRESVLLVINRGGAKFKEAISTLDFERICHRRVDLVIPNDIKAVTHAENMAKTLFETEQDSRIRAQIAALAQRVAGLARPGEQFAPKKGLLSKFIKK